MKKIAFALLLAALNANGASQPLSSANVPYISGGVGDEELADVRAHAAEFNLHLLFADKGTGQYLANVTVRIDDAQGRPVLAAESNGPLFYAKLASGHYRLTVEANGQQQQRQISIKPGQPAETAFYWAEAGNST